MYLPASTYRLQIHSKFPLSQVKALVPYLHKMGISTLYAAPIFQARGESNHGYDVTNPDHISTAIGSLEELKEINQWLKQHQMGWLQDIVPNHMAFESSNTWLMDVFEKGPHSTYASFFDIDWQHPDPDLKRKVIAPFLGKEPRIAIEEGDMRLTHDENALYLEYGSFRFPLSWTSYYDVLKDVKLPEVFQGECQKILDELLMIKNNLDSASLISSALHLKKNLFHFFSSQAPLRGVLEKHLQVANQRPDWFLFLLDQQYFRLVHHTQSQTRMNYRRFFAVSELICLRIEDQRVFERYHKFIKTLVDQKLVDGLRVDHIDGLQLPKEYLERLRDLAGKDTYLIVEKILDAEEKMPDKWPIQGTSGYEFLGLINQLFSSSENRDRLWKTYKDFTGLHFDYEALVQEKKAYMLKTHMGGELENLCRLLSEVEKEKTEGLNKERLKQAIFVLLTSFPVYRTYLDNQSYSYIDQRVLGQALKVAKEKDPSLDTEWQVFESLFTSGLERESTRRFVMRLQQFTGPLAAKGVEDTVFYVFNPWVGHNEVGDSPKNFGISTQDFHQAMQERKVALAYSLNTLSTHDTKRGEDARARLNALTEMAEDWDKIVYEWTAINKKHKTAKGQEQWPVANDEYFLYQSLLGSFPMDGKTSEEFKTRLQDFMLKALHEAKVYTDYPQFNTEYEEATLQFAARLLEDPAFLEAFIPFFKTVSNAGILLSLSQILIKNTAPGIPDTYQGAELWDLNLVDPDNRREIDFQQRAKWLDELEAHSKTALPALLQELLVNKRDGRIKLYTTWKSLHMRTVYKTLFEKGDYLPLEFSGEKNEWLLGYARHYEDLWTLTIVPKKAMPHTGREEWIMGFSAWGNTQVLLPQEAPKKWENGMTGEEMQTFSCSLNVAEVLSEFPVALLVGKE